MKTRKRVLFVAEAVTLAHVARPIALASRLDPNEFEVVLACAPRYREFFPRQVGHVHEIYSITSAQFLTALANGRPLYDLATLRRYVSDDLQLLARVKPSVVVGDFRLSLAVSARHLRVPYVSLSNAYWSPFARPNFQLPSHPMTRFVGRPLASVIFRMVRPIAFAYHALPINRLRREFGLDGGGLDLRQVYTDADYVAYADIPEIIPTRDLPSHHSYIGPVLWSPPISPPSWWDSLGTASPPLIYVTMGSSGDSALLPRIIEALAALPAQVVVASAGAPIPAALPANVHCAEYLPGELIAKRAKLFVCNGGSPTSQQALVEGVPVLGVTRNMDQFLNMDFIAARGAGLRLRADELRVQEMRAQARRMLNERSFRSAAAQVAGELRAYDASARFTAILRAATQDARWMNGASNQPTQLRTERPCAK
jgi:UDP:flavonoid glycosyltransferase YjiC (YdhE family)